ncbi:MAG: sulfatase, partial [Acidobacteria bacterium]|nr:sulfatase [Acidobacteriota bacterium]
MTVTRRAALAAPFLNLRAQNKQDKPNILWILGDDLGPQLGCYGHKLVSTPNVDRIAAEGARFTHCFTTAPVCSPSRSGWNTGVYQTTTGAH